MTFLPGGEKVDVDLYYPWSAEAFWKTVKPRVEAKTVEVRMKAFHAGETVVARVTRIMVFGCPVGGEWCRE